MSSAPRKRHPRQQDAADGTVGTMLPSCPRCGSTRAWISRPQGISEKIGQILGRQPARCRECRHRYIAKFRNWEFWRFARCPRCYRVELGQWQEEYYRPRWPTRLALVLGAKPVRCEACRYNFTSYRRVWEKAAENENGSE